MSGAGSGRAFPAKEKETVAVPTIICSTLSGGGGGSIALNPNVLHTFHSFALGFTVSTVLHFVEAQPCTAADIEGHAAVSIGKSVAHYTCHTLELVSLQCAN